MKYRILVGLVAFVLIAACGGKEEAASKKPRLYQRSELSLLMREMYDASLQLKGNLRDSTLRADYAALFHKIHVAQATEEALKENNFGAFASAWEASWESLLREENEVEMAFNVMVDQCVNCHTGRCPGPIPKIKRLKITDETKIGSNR